MGRFYINGIITDISENLFGANKNIRQTILTIEETIPGEHPVTYTHRVEFNGRFANQVPTQDNDLKKSLLGANVVAIGILSGKLWNDKVIEACRGEQLLVLSFPRFEDEIPGDKNKVTEDVDNDLPF